MPEDDADVKQGLHVEFLTVEDLFSGRFTFYLPWFQRAYAWTEDHADRLLTDITLAMRAGERRYFIGHIMLSGAPDSRHKALVDGHQRTVTLTILFALLRRATQSAPMHARLDRMILADPADGVAFRLSPQPSVAAFFRDHIQLEQDAEHLIDLVEASDTERNILNNRNKLAATLQDLNLAEGEIDLLADYIMRRCVLVTEIVDDEEEAWQMLETEEGTGLAFHASERHKITLISTMPREEQEAAGRIWESWQSALGDDGISELLYHLRELSSRRRSSQPVEKDIVTRFALARSGLAFMQEHFIPGAERMIAIRTGQIGRTEHRPLVAKCIDHMDWLGHKYWYPPAIKWLQQRGSDDPLTLSFFELLERKTWLLRIAGADPLEHLRRFNALIQQIDQETPPSAISELAVPDKTLRNAIQSLLSRTFYDKKFSRPVLRYVCELYGADPGYIDGKRVTVEHVLPRSPDNNSQWRKDFGTRKQIGDFAHRIGNMAFLSFEANQAVGNKDYAVKRQYLAESGFALSSDAAQAEEWTPQHVLARSEALVDVLLANWSLARP